MKKVPLREFQQRGSQLLSELPIVLTQYGKPIAIIRLYKTGNEILQEVGVANHTTVSNPEDHIDLVLGDKKVVKEVIAKMNEVVDKPKKVSIKDKVINFVKNSKGKDKIVNQFSLCPKHKVMFRSCGCSY